MEKKCRNKKCLSWFKPNKRNKLYCCPQCCKDAYIQKRKERIEKYNRLHPKKWKKNEPIDILDSIISTCKTHIDEKDIDWDKFPRITGYSSDPYDIRNLIKTLKKEGRFKEICKKTRIPPFMFEKYPLTNMQYDKIMMYL